MSEEEEELHLDDLIKTNTRLNEQVKQLTAYNEELLSTIRDLEKDIEELRKQSTSEKTSVKKKGITVMCVEFVGFKNIHEGGRQQTFTTY